MTLTCLYFQVFFTDSSILRLSRYVALFLGNIFSHTFPLQIPILTVLSYEMMLNKKMFISTRALLLKKKKKVLGHCYLLNETRNRHWLSFCLNGVSVSRKYRVACWIGQEKNTEIIEY